MLELEVDALQRVAAAVKDVEAADFQEIGRAALSHEPPRALVMAAGDMTAAQIQFLHLGIGLDLVRRAFLEDAAVVHHRHALDDAQRDVHVVLDDDVADMGGKRGQDGDEIAALGRRQARRRLVEQNEARRAGERQRDFELALLAVREFADQTIRHRFEMHERNQIGDRLHDRVACARAQEREAAARHAAAGEIDVLAHGEAAGTSSEIW